MNTTTAIEGVFTIVSTPEPTRPCPECGASLQPLRGGDGYVIEHVVLTDDRGQWVQGRMTEVKRMNTVWACPCCEYAV